MNKIDLLPPQTLSNIFILLCVEDRKKVRLTCRAWNLACNCPEIIATEKFVIRKGYDGGNMKYLGACIIKCTHLRQHWEFQNLSLLRLPSKVWGLCGSKIESLRLHDSGVDDQCMSNIIQYCTNLIDLRVRYAFADSMIKSDKREGVAFCSERALRDMIRRKIVRKKLTTFKLYMDRQISNKMYEKIYKIYPHIKKLGQGFYRMLDCACELHLLGYDPADRFVLPPMIENFTSHTWDLTSMQWNMPKQKLRGLSTMLNLEQSLFVPDVLMFFSDQTELEKVHLVVAHGEPNNDEDHITAMELLFHIVKSCRKLKKLYFHSFCADCDVVIKFGAKDLSDFLSLTSGMESVTLISGCGITLDVSSVESPSLPSTEYTKLKHLELRNDIDEGIIMEILNRCRVPLKSLYLSPVDDKIMRKIFKSQTELQTLRIKDVKCSKAGLIGVRTVASLNCRKAGLIGVRRRVAPKREVKFSFGQLKNLQHLRIEEISLNLLQDIPLEFNLPALRSFEIQFKFKEFFGPTRNMERKIAGLVVQMLLEALSIFCPLIEILKVDEDVISAKKLIKYCKRWNYLRFLGLNVIMKKDMFDDVLPEAIQEAFIGPNVFDRKVVDVEELFAQCPSLHYVANYTLACAYYYDRFASKLKLFSENFTALDHKYDVFKNHHDE